VKGAREACFVASGRGRRRGRGSDFVCLAERREGGGAGCRQQRGSNGHGQRVSRAAELKGKASLTGGPWPQCKAAALNSF
jgi:hypothetical protein